MTPVASFKADSTRSFKVRRWRGMAARLPRSHLRPLTLPIFCCSPCNCAGLIPPKPSIMPPSSIFPNSFIIFIMFCTPPICCSMRGSMALCIFCMTWAGFLPSCVMSPPFPKRPLLPILPTIFSILLYSSSNCATSACDEPEPRAMRFWRESVICTIASSSSSVRLSIMTMKRLMRLAPSFSAPCGNICDIPGIICMICPIGPIFWRLRNCSYKSRKENLPLDSFLRSSGCLSRGITSVMLWKRPLRSPMPRRRETNDCGSKVLNSSKCSPVPKKMMGEFVAATAESAPPPLA
mmetsp:Transcript_2391/g.5520  ORF Transcript_2391/g.5520 Transcript_2391/m.5520 type:complete len:293 (-) Transcript_2391:815-1693(-)